MTVWVIDIEYVLTNVELERRTWIRWLFTFRCHVTRIAIERSLTNRRFGWA